MHLHTYVANNNDYHIVIIKGRLFLQPAFYEICVELTGFEPVSERGSNMLSTCLSSPQFSCQCRTEATNHGPYLLNFSHSRRSVRIAIPDTPAPPFQSASGNGQLGDVSFPSLSGNKVDLLNFNQATRA